MIYGKAVCRIQDRDINTYLTVADGTCTIKQGEDIIRLSREGLRELANDALQSLDELEAGKLA